GRKFSIYTRIKTGQGLGKRIGFPTLNMDVQKLCLPPFGVYAVKVVYGDKHHKGVANLGIAPTVRQDEKPLLEVHLLDKIEKIENNSFIEVVFHSYIRPEMRFESIDHLKEQIGKDVLTAKKIMN